MYVYNSIKIIQNLQFYYFQFHAINDDFQAILSFHIVQIHLFLIKFDMLL